MGTNYNALAAQMLADGLNNGMGYLVQSKLKKEDSAEQLERDARLAAAQKALQQEKLAQDAKLFFADQTFRGGQADADRTFRSGERVATQQFEGDQRGQDRTLSADQLNARLTADATQLQQRLAQEKLLADAARMQSQGQFDKKFDWDKDPANPDNKSREAYTRKLNADAGDFGGTPSPVTYKSADDVKAAYQSGKLTRDEAKKILQSSFGLK